MTAIGQKTDIKGRCWGEGYKPVTDVVTATHAVIEVGCLVAILAALTAGHLVTPAGRYTEAGITAISATKDDPISLVKGKISFAEHGGFVDNRRSFES